jgi:hypothetical protein
MKTASILTLLAAASCADATKFSKEKAVIKSIAAEAKANLLARLPTDQCWEEKKKHGCTREKLVYRKE